MDSLNEALLKLLSLLLRSIQFTLSLVVIACMSQFLSSLSDHDLALPQTHVAVLAISGVGALWSFIALILTCCAGKVMLELETTLDLVCTGLSIAQAAVLSKDATCTRRAFVGSYGYGGEEEAWAGWVPERRFVKACFGVAVVCVILFASTSMMSWAVFMMKKRLERLERLHHHGEK